MRCSLLPHPQGSFWNDCLRLKLNPTPNLLWKPRPHLTRSRFPSRFEQAPNQTSLRKTLSRYPHDPLRTPRSVAVIVAARTDCLLARAAWPTASGYPLEHRLDPGRGQAAPDALG